MNQALYEIINFLTNKKNSLYTKKNKKLDLFSLLNPRYSIRPFSTLLNNKKKAPII